MKKCLSCKNTFESPGSWKCPRCGNEPKRVNGFYAFAPAAAVSGSGFRTEAFSAMYDLESKNFWFRSKQKLLAWTMKRFFTRANSYLEAGCGTGFFLAPFEKAFPTLPMHGTDLFIEGLANAQTRVRRTELFQSDLCAIPFEAEFDVIGAYDVLEHVPDDRAVLREFHAALKPGGGIILTAPQHPFLWSWIDDFLCHKRRYRSGEFAARTAAAGFTVIFSTSSVSLLFPFMVASRFAQKIKPPAKYDPEVDLKINPVLNRIFEWVMTFERLLIESGLRFPFGGSALVVAVKN
jgi:SAM-dependent methyltransferase